MHHRQVVFVAVLSLGFLLVSSFAVGLGAGARAPVASTRATPPRASVAPSSIVPFFPNIRVTDNSSPYAWQVEPTMVINRSGTIFAGWKETDGPDAAGLRVGASYSLDHGQTWAPNILMNQDHQNQGCANSDPWMALTPNDTVDYAYLEFNCNAAASGLDVSNTTDGTWGSVHFIGGHGGLVDKDSIAVDAAGRLYATWDENNVLALTWSDDGGNHWAPIQNPGNIGDIVLGSVVGTKGNSSVYLTWWDINTDNIMFEASNDRGQTWGAPVQVNSMSGSASQVGSWQIPIPSMNVDPNSGNIYIAWPDSRNGNQDIFIANSTNGGASFGANHRINDDSGSSSQYMVDLAVDGTGKVHAAWEDGREGAWNIYYANSTDGGNSWTPNIKVTTASTPFTYDRPGDYFALRAGPDNTIYIVWTDGRGTDFDIYYARNPGFPSATVTVTTQPAGLPVTVDGASAKSPVTNTWILNSTHTVSVAQTVRIATGSRWNWTSWSDGGALSHPIVASQDTTITATFTKQFSAQASVSPSGLTYAVDNVSYTAAFSGWWNANSSHWIATSSPQYASPDVRYLWSGWSDGGAIAHAVQATTPRSFVATFGQQQGLRITTSPSGLNFTFDGTDYTGAQVFWLTPNTFHAVSVSTLETPGGGIRYRFASWTDGGAANHVVDFTGPTQIQANFTAEFYLTVDSPVPGGLGSGWFANGSTARASVTYTTYLEGPGARAVFQGWSGDGSGNGTTSNAIVMNGPKTAIAEYQTQYFLQVTSAYGTPGGSAWYPSGTSATATVDTATVSLGTGSRALFSSWGGDATGTNAADSAPIPMDGPHTAIANWQVQYLVTVTSDVGTVQGGGWYNAGSTATLTAPASASQGGQTYNFAGWQGDVGGTTTSVSFTVNGPLNVRATWTTPSSTTGLADTTLVAIAIGVFVVILIAVLVVWLRRRKKEEPPAP